MRATQFIAKMPQDILDTLGGNKEYAKVCAKAHEDNKALRLTVWNDRSSRMSEFRMRPCGFYIEVTLDEKGKPNGRQLCLAGAVCYWDWQVKAWNDAKERGQAIPLWTVIGAEILDEPARTDAPVPNGYKRIYPVSADTLRSQQPNVVPLVIAQRALKSKQWAERPTMDVLE
jgi:hypothetical protein